MAASDVFVTDLDIVMRDLSWLQTDHELWSSLNDNLRVHPWAGQPGTVMDFITRSHFVALGIGLRRQIDRDPASVSLANLIARVASRKVVFRRADYVARYVARYPHDAAHWAGVGDRDFTSLCCDATAPFYPPCRADRHLEWLSRRADPLRTFVNRSIAHRSQKEPDVPTIRYCERLLWCMLRLWEHYCFVATGSFPALEPDLLGDDWKEALTRPWMPDER